MYKYMFVCMYVVYVCMYISYTYVYVCTYIHIYYIHTYRKFDVLYCMLSCVCWSVLECVGVCWRVLQCAAVYVFYCMPSRVKGVGVLGGGV